MSKTKSCDHLKAIVDVRIGEPLVCDECVKNGTAWVHLRTCQTCGITLCCNTSRMHHMTNHFHSTGHPVIASAEPGERWLWCYPDQIFSEY